MPTEPSCRDQQIAEALAMLVALRLWSNQWTDSRLNLAVFTDNIATLALVAKMQPHSANLGTLGLLNSVTAIFVHGSHPLVSKVRNPPLALLHGSLPWTSAMVFSHLMLLHTYQASPMSPRMP